MAYTTNYSLLEKIQRQDEISWQEFYLRYAPFIAAIARKKGLDADAAQEIIQLTMTEIFQKNILAQYRRDLGKFHDYLSGIVQHRVYSFFRERNKRVQFDEKNIGGDDWDAFFRQEYLTYLTQLMLDALRNRVAETTFEAFYFTEIEHRSAQETAAMLGISTISVYTNRSRCLKHLKQLARELRQNNPEFPYPFGE